MLCLRTGKSWRMRSTSKRAETTLLSVLMEFLEEGLFQLVLQSRDFYPVDNILREGVGKQVAGLAAADAAGLQVEEGFSIQLADCGAVRTAHIVRQDLQFRLGVDNRIIR